MSSAVILLMPWAMATLNTGNDSHASTLATGQDRRAVPLNARDAIHMIGSVVNTALIG